MPSHHVLPRITRRAFRRSLLAAALLTATAAFAADDRAAAPAAASIDPAHWPQPAWPFPADAALERRIDALMATMTLEEKVAQVSGESNMETRSNARLGIPSLKVAEAAASSMSWASWKLRETWPK